ncbi:hypothetical protein K5D65_21765 [Pseudomonas cichorii]|nr:hypothetical protein [Pseudomonas cichorii]
MRSALLVDTDRSCTALPLHAAQLNIELADGVHTWETGQLLNHPDVQDVQIADDVSYKQALHYRAVPMARLLEGVTAQDHLQIAAIDGFAAGYLKRYLRDPQSLRHWPQAKMPAISPDIVSDEELEQIIAYLQHMAQRRVH